VLVTQWTRCENWKMDEGAASQTTSSGCKTVRWLYNAVHELLLWASTEKGQNLGLRCSLSQP